MNVAEVLWEEPALLSGPALRVGGSAWTRADLAEATAAFAGVLVEEGVEPGDRVLLACATSADFVVAYHAVLAAGAVVVTINPRCKAPELEYFLEDAGCSLALGHEAGASALVEAAEAKRVPVLMVDATHQRRARPRRPVPRRAEDLAVLLYTSGTTGRPKGAELTHGNLRACTSAVIERLELTDADRVGTALPLFHVYGQAVVMGAALRVGATLSLLHPFTAEDMLRMVADDRLTVAAGVPTMWVDLVHAPMEQQVPHFLRIALSGGAPLPAEVARTLRGRFGCALVEGYGLSEATGVATMGSADGRRPEGSVGYPLPGIEVRVLGPDGEQAPHGTLGEVAVRGPVLMRGYWRRPLDSAEVRRGEWLLTGDIGHQDSDGHLWVVDRKKELIIRGGYNVYPREVEEQLYEHPAIREAAVVGVPDGRLGEEIAAVVALHDGAALAPGDLRSWLSTRLADYKVPRLYLVVDVLPKGATGKIHKLSIDRAEVLAASTRVTSGSGVARS